MPQCRVKALHEDPIKIALAMPRHVDASLPQGITPCIQSPAEMVHDGALLAFAARTADLAHHRVSDLGCVPDVFGPHRLLDFAGAAQEQSLRPSHVTSGSDEGLDPKASSEATEQEEQRQRQQPRPPRWHLGIRR